MKDKITKIFDNIESRFKQALGINVAFVKFPEQIGSIDSANLAMEITLTADYEAGANFTKNDDLIRDYLRNVGMQGTWKRSIVRNEAGENAVVYKINLATTERGFGVLGYLGAKLDNLTLNSHAAEGFAKKTGKLIEAIDRDFKPKQGWAYAASDIRVIEEGSGLQPNARLPEKLTNIVDFEVFDKERHDAVAQRYIERSGREDEPIGEATSAVINARAALKAALEAKSDGRE